MCTRECAVMRCNVGNYEFIISSRCGFINSSAGASSALHRKHSYTLEAIERALSENVRNVVIGTICLQYGVISPAPCLFLLRLFLSLRPSRRAHAPPAPSMSLLLQQLLLRPCSSSVLTFTVLLVRIRSEPGPGPISGIFCERRTSRTGDSLASESGAQFFHATCTRRCILIPCADRHAAGSVALVGVVRRSPESW